MRSPRRGFPRRPPRPARAAFPLLRLALGLALALTVAAPLAAAPRVVAIADVHGDLPAFEAVLRAAGVLDARGSWAGGDTVVVQLGDLVDRGPAMKGVLDFVIGLESRAAAGGGRYVSLLGNHEVMNLVGDLRYVAPENWAEFAGADAERRQARAWRDFQRWRKERAAARGEAAPDTGEQAKRTWLAAHPPGLVEHREAFSPEGRYGRWLRARPVTQVVDGTLFVHGGIAPERVHLPLAAIDRQVHEEIARFDELRSGFVADGLALPFFDLSELTLALRAELDALDRAEAAARTAAEAKGGSYAPPAANAALRARIERFLDWGNWSIFTADGPTWYRGYGLWDESEGAAELPKLLAAYGVARIVVGHTPQAKGSIQSRFDGAVYLLDTGMLSSYYRGGRGSALEIINGSVTAIYAGGERETLHRAATAEEPVAADPAPAPAPESTQPAAAPAPSEAPQPAARPGFLGPDGQPLPFAGEDELLAFLREAEVVEVKDIGEGITKPRRLTLERGGLRVRGIFRDVQIQKNMAQVGGGRREVNFRDYYGFEPAAYRLGKLLGLAAIPPSDLRRYKGQSGSIQLWIERGTTEGRRKEAGTTPPNSLRWKRQLQMMLVWDALVGNTDRNQGNILFDPDWKMWLIDHTRSFRGSEDLANEDRIIWCERGFYERLRAVSDDEIRAAVEGLLRPGELRALLARRKKVVDLFEARIRERGETSVLFTWSG